MSLEETLGALLDARLAPLRSDLERVSSEVASLRRALPPMLVSVAVAAQRLGVSLATARRRVKAGEWPVRRDGRRVLVDMGAMGAKSKEELSELSRSLRASVNEVGHAREA